MQYRITISENHHKPKFHEIIFAPKLFYSCLIILKIYTEHGSGTVMLCVKFQNDPVTKMDVMDKLVFMRFEFELNFSATSQIARAPCILFFVLFFPQSTKNYSCYIYINMSPHDMVNFPKNTHYRQHKGHPWGQAMGSLLSVQPLNPFY